MEICEKVRKCAWWLCGCKKKNKVIQCWNCKDRHTLVQEKSRRLNQAEHVVLQNRNLNILTKAIVINYEMYSKMRDLKTINLNFYAVWKVSKCEVLSGLYFHVFGLNTGKYGPEKAPYLDIFHTVLVMNVQWFLPLPKLDGFY